MENFIFCAAIVLDNLRVDEERDWNATLTLSSVLMML